MIISIKTVLTAIITRIKPKKSIIIITAIIMIINMIALIISKINTTTATQTHQYVENGI